MKLSNSPALRAHAKGALFAIVITLTSILFLALFVQIAGLSGGAVGFFTQVIKAISIFVGVLIVIRRIERKAWMHGAILGLVYTAFTFLLLGIIDSSFSTAAGFFVEALFATSVGLASAMLLRLRKRDA